MNAVSRALLIALIASDTAIAVNLVPYPDFDTPNDLGGWSIVGNGLPTAVWDGTENATGLGPHSGSVLLRIEGPPGSAGAMESSCIPMSSGTHRAGTWAKTRADQGAGPSDSIGVVVNYYDDPGCAQNSVIGGSGASFPPTPVWTLNRAASTAPVGTMGAKIVISLGKGPANGTPLDSWFDGAVLETEEIFVEGFDG